MVKDLEMKKNDLIKRQNVWIASGVVQDPKDKPLNPELEGKALFGRRDSFYDAADIAKDLEYVKIYKDEVPVRGKRLDKNVVKYEQYYWSYYIKFVNK